jgi:hypothetical protein
MPDLEQDLRATEESILRDADRLTALESSKAELDPEDGRVGELSTQVEETATRLQRKARAERELADRIESTK